MASGIVTSVKEQSLWHTHKPQYTHLYIQPHKSHSSIKMALTQLQSHSASRSQNLYLDGFVSTTIDKTFDIATGHIIAEWRSLTRHHAKASELNNLATMAKPVAHY